MLYACEACGKKWERNGGKGKLCCACWIEGRKKAQLASWAKRDKEKKK